MRTRGFAAQFGNAVRERRQEQGMTQEALADAADVHRTYVGDVERGHRNVTLVTAGRLAEALSIPLSELIARAERHK